MKRLIFLLSICLCFCLMTGCSAEDSAPPSVPEQPPVSAGGPGALISCRIVSLTHDTLLLAKHDSTSGDIYTLGVGDLPIGDGAGNFFETDVLRPGLLIDIDYSGTIMESYPGQLSQPTGITVCQIGFDDRCALYLKVLEDLWNKDPGLNDGAEMIGVDLSQTSLPLSEQAAVAWAFASNHGAIPVQGSWNELIESGYISAEPLTSTGSGLPDAHMNACFYEWKNGCHFSIVEQLTEGTYSLMPVTFDAQKWRSSLGAYYFSNCTAIQSALGEWSDYTIGSEMIS